MLTALYGGDTIEHFGRGLSARGACCSQQDVSLAWRAMEWLGLTASGPFDGASPTLLDALCAVLQRRLAYAAGERDMVVMQHTFIVERDSVTSEISSSLIAFGDGEEGGFTAMAKTVGYPVALATEAILDGEISMRGVVAPIDRTIYAVLLERLCKLAGIVFKEHSRVCSPPAAGMAAGDPLPLASSSH